MPRIAVYLMAASRMIRWLRLHELMTWIDECDAKRLGTSFKAALRREQFTSGDRDNDRYAYRPEHVINRCNPYLLLTFWGELQGKHAVNPAGELTLAVWRAVRGRRLA